MSQDDRLETDPLRFRLTRGGELHATGVQFTSGTVVVEDANPLVGDMTFKPGDNGLTRLKEELPEDVEFHWLTDDIERVGLLDVDAANAEEPATVSDGGTEL